MALFTDIGKTLSATKQDVTQKTRDVAEGSRLKGQIEANEKKIAVLYGEIGKICYEHCKDDQCVHAALFSAQVQDIRQLRSQNKGLQERLRQLKGIRKCPICGAEIMQSARFCSQCGSPVAAQEQQFCIACGKRLEPGSKFCIFCGERVLEDIDKEETITDSGQRRTETPTNDSGIPEGEACDDDLNV